MNLQCATFSKSLNPRNIDKSVSDIQIRIRFQFENGFWISASGCKFTILPDIQLSNRIVIISVSEMVTSVEYDPVSGSRSNRILQFRTGSGLDWILKKSLPHRIWMSKLR